MVIACILLTNLTNSNYPQIKKSQQTTFTFPVLNVGDIMTRRVFHCSPLALPSMESITESEPNTCIKIYFTSNIHKYILKIVEKNVSKTQFTEEKEIPKIIDESVSDAYN